MRKARNDAIPAAVKAMEAAASPVHPPASVPLRAVELRFFAAIVDEAAKSEWTAHSLEIAAMLARSMAALEEEQPLLRAEGSVLTSDLGTRTPNQRVSVVASLTSAVLAFRRSLQLHARASARDLATAAARRRALKALEAGLPPDGSLLS